MALMRKWRQPNIPQKLYFILSVKKIIAGPQKLAGKPTDNKNVEYTIQVTYLWADFLL